MEEFPDHWEFCGKTQEQYAQVGNAVPVRLGEVRGKLVAQELAAIYEAGLTAATGDYPAYRVVHAKSHIRTRQWFRAVRPSSGRTARRTATPRIGAAKTSERSAKFEGGPLWLARTPECRDQRPGSQKERLLAALVA